MRKFPTPSLAARTTIRLGGQAICELCPESVAELPRMEEELASLGGRPYVIGCGSNLLADDGDLPFVLINLKYLRQIEILEQDSRAVLLKAQAGSRLGSLLRFCMANGFSGLEGLIGIPGSVGGACAMNAGSFGCCIGDCLESLEVWSEGKLSQIPKQAIKTGYRSIIIENFPILPLIVSANFALTRSLKSVMFKVMNQDIIQKKSRQPVTAWSAGCAFKNPSHHAPAGKLLEEAGFRGKELGGMAFSEMHANFLINRGSGSARAAHELLHLAQTEIHGRTGVRLEPEIRFLQCHW